LPAEHTRALEELSARGRKIALFAGSLVPANQLDVIIAASAALVGSNCHLVVVGRGPEEARIRAALQERPELPLTLLPAIEQAAVPSLIAAAHVGVAALGAYSLYQHGISLNKVFEYLGCGCPVVLAAAAPHNVVELSGAGRCVPPAQPAALAAAIRELGALSREQRDELGARGRAYVHAAHDFATMATRYLDLLGSLRPPRRLSDAL
jgi:glycosyltransferase involved in cell wall biosynthesis